MEVYDVIVVGGGPAGSSAALVLGRSRLNVLMIDKGTPRNIRTHGIHAYLTRNDIKPVDFRRLAHEEVLAVGVTIQVGGAVGLQQEDNGGFVLHMEHGEIFKASRVVLATGIADRMPEVEGMDALYGISAFHCPFCDGWEWRDRSLAVYGRGKKGVAMARGLLTWSVDVMLFTDGELLTKRELANANAANITVHTDPIKRMVGSKGELHSIELGTGVSINRDAIFFDPDPQQQCGIAAQLGCTTTKSGAVRTDKKQRTEIPGLYVAGDAAADPNMVVIAAADGVKAALNIVQEMQKEGHWLPSASK